MLRFYTAGESHGQALLAFVSGLPAGMPVDLEFINHELHRRQLGYGRGGRQKIEKDRADIFAGVRHGQTIGAPIALRIENRDWANWEKILPVEASDAPEASSRKLVAPRPGHADLAGSQKFNFHDARYVLERASARETAARVAAGAFAQATAGAIRDGDRQPHDSGGACAAGTSGDSGMKFKRSAQTWNRRCAAWTQRAQEKMKAEVDAALKAGDTVGGVFEIVAHNVPVGLGSHAQWDEKLDGRLAQALMSVQAVKAVEIGAGILAAGSYGSEVQDEISYDKRHGNFIASFEPRGGTGRRHHQRRRCGDSRVPEADFDAAEGAGHRGHGDQGAGAGGLRAIGLVRGAGRRCCRRSHGGTCASGCFSAKIWRRFTRRDAGGISKAMADKSTSSEAAATVAKTTATQRQRRCAENLSDREVRRSRCWKSQRRPCKKF